MTAMLEIYKVTRDEQNEERARLLPGREGEAVQSISWSGHW